MPITENDKFKGLMGGKAGDENVYVLWEPANGGETLCETREAFNKRIKEIPKDERSEGIREAVDLIDGGPSYI